MHPVNRALAYIEANLAHDICVDEIADYSAISRFHLSRVFSHATGYTLARYVRLRRLTEAAQILRETQDSVLNIALKVGYDCHASFTRAFTNEFGLSPTDFRDGEADDVALVHPVLWSETRNVAVPTPRIVDGLDVILTGYQEHFDDGTEAAPMGVFELAHRFVGDISHIQDKTGPGLFQHVFDVDPDHSFAYEVLMGVPVTGDRPTPPGMIKEHVQWPRYAAFPFEIPANQINPAGFAVAIDWFPQSDFDVAGRTFIQFYEGDVHATPEDMPPIPDPDTVTELEIWVPIK